MMMHEQLNSISFMGDANIKRSVAELRKSFDEANNRRGIGFVIFGQVLNFRALLMSASILYTLGSTFVLHGDAMLGSDSEMSELSRAPGTCNCSANVVTTTRGDVAAALQDPAVIEAIIAALGRQ